MSENKQQSETGENLLTINHKVVQLHI